MSDPQTPPHDPEIHIDLDGDPDPDPEPRRRPRIPNAVLALAAVLITLAAGSVAVWKWLPANPSSAEHVVREFLESVRGGDVDAALDMIGDVPEVDYFLVPEALDERWEIAEIAQVQYEQNPRTGSMVAKVYVEIVAHDGTRLGNRLTVLFEDGEDAVIVGGISTAEFYAETLEFIDVNGVVVESDEPMTLRLLPGLYEFYRSAPPTLETEEPQVLALGNRSIPLGSPMPRESLSAPWPVASDHGIAALDERVREYFDACAAGSASAGCPFAYPPGTGDAVSIADDAAWTITAYPEAAVLQWNLSGGRGYELVTARPGSVEVEATLAEPGGGTRETTLSCALWVDGMYGFFDHDGGVELIPGSRYDQRCRTMAAVD
ncbi:hypothetical protein GCM10027447_25200 [Glycomyces halotolerans]